jgi:hypothetical protein
VRGLTPRQTWDQLFQDYGPGGALMRLSKQMEQRQVPLRLFAALLALCPALAEVRLSRVHAHGRC